MHAFIGTDGTTNQYTAFINPQTMKPMIIKYQKQTMLIREDDWMPRTSWSDEEFKLATCHTKTGKIKKNRVIRNNDAPMIFMSYFGILA